MTEKVEPIKAPEGSELEKLPDFRDWGKEGTAPPEPEAVPPTINEVVNDSGVAITPTDATEDLVELAVRKAAHVMHHSVVAAVQILSHETGANQPVINMEMQTAIPAALLYQMATPIAKAIFDKVYTDDLASMINFKEQKKE